MGFNPFDSIFKKSIESVFDGINENTEKYRKSFDLLKRFRGRHAKKISEGIGTVQILGMTGAIPLVDLYVSTRFTEKIKRNLFLGETEGAGEQVSVESIVLSEIDLIPAIRETSNILLLGGPGSGKTTFVSALVLGLLGDGKIGERNLDEIRLPIHFVLREIRVVPKDLRTLVKNYLTVIDEVDAMPFVEKMLRQGRVQLIFDGLDEVPPDHQSKWVKAIEKFRVNFELPPIIVTCRTGALEVDFSNFRHLEILPFTSEDSEKFVRSWFVGEHANKGEQLLDSLKDNPKIQELTNTPLLLSLLCNLYENDLELSSNRTDLYTRCVEVMMVRWDTSRGFKRKSSFDGLSIARRKKILEYVAYNLLINDGAVLSDAKAKNRVGEYIERYDIDKGEAPEILCELESHHGLLLRPAANCWCFSHTSFEEFFAAEYILDRRDEIKFLKGNFKNVSRREVIVFISSLMEDAEDFFRTFVKLTDIEGLETLPAIGKRLRPLSLLVRCVSQGVALPKPLRNEINKFIVLSVCRAIALLESTSVYLYGQLAEGEIRISYTYYKKFARKSTGQIFWPLNALVLQIAKCNYLPLLEEFEKKVESSRNESERLVLSACCYLWKPEIMRDIYREFPSDLNQIRYLGHISAVADTL